MLSHSRLLVLFLAMVWLGGPGVSAVLAAEGKLSEIELEFERLKKEGKARVIVQFKEAVGSVQEGLLAKYTKNFKRVKIIKAAICDIKESDIAALSSEPGVKAAVRDALVRAPDIERDAVPSQVLTDSYPDPWTDWNLQVEGIAATTAWSRYPGIDGSGVKVATIDSGVNYTLPDLDAPYYLGGYDFVNWDDDPMDDFTGGYGHGTLVLSILVAQGDLKIKGVAPRVSHYALKVLNEYGIGDMAKVVMAIDWAVDPDGDPNTHDSVDVINFSMGGRNLDPTLRQLLIEACDAAYSAGVVLVAAAGNEAQPTSSDPAAFENVISAGGHGKDQTLYVNSNGGADFVAPGRRVWAMDMWGETTDSADGLRWYYTGTSFSAPHVSGAMALMLHYARQQNIEVNNGYLWEALKHSARDLGLDPNYQGKGKVWLAKASPEDADEGCLDLLAGGWPLDHAVQFSNYAYLDEGGYPVYFIGSNMSQAVRLQNITDALGQYADDIADLTVTVTQQYYQREGEANLPGSPVTEVAVGSVAIGQLLDPAATVNYTQPGTVIPGLNKTRLKLRFKIAGVNRWIECGWPAAAIWRTAARPRLTLNVINPTYGEVAVEPNLPEYEPYAVVTLTATPIEGKSFRQFEIYDPNHPGDANYVTYDANNPITLVMDRDRSVTAAFKCGTGLAPLPPLTLGVLGLVVLVRRRS